MRKKRFEPVFVVRWGHGRYPESKSSVILSMKEKRKKGKKEKRKKEKGKREKRKRNTGSRLTIIHI